MVDDSFGPSTPKQKRFNFNDYTNKKKKKLTFSAEYMKEFTSKKKDLLSTERNLQDIN